jgi:DNA polymerase-3 subunit beta
VIQFSIVAEVLLKLCKMVSGVIERRVSSDKHGHGMVLLRLQQQQLTLLGHDQSIEISAIATLPTAQINGELLLPLHKLFDIVRAVRPNTVLDIQVDENIVIRASGMRFVLGNAFLESYPRFVLDRASVEFETTIQQFNHLLHRTSFAIAEQDIRLFLNSLSLEGEQQTLQALAADGHRLCLEKLSLATALPKSFNVMLPRRAVLELQRVLTQLGSGVLTVRIFEKHIQLVTKSFGFVACLAGGRAPNFHTTIPYQHPFSMRLDKEMLKEALLRAAVILGEEKHKFVLWEIQPQQLKIKASNQQNDCLEESLTIDYDGAALVIGFNVSYWLDFLSLVTEPILLCKFKEAEQSVLVEPVTAEGKSNGAYVIMPIQM